VIQHQYEIHQYLKDVHRIKQDRKVAPDKFICSVLVSDQGGKAEFLIEDVVIIKQNDNYV